MPGNGDEIGSLRKFSPSFIRPPNDPSATPPTLAERGGYAAKRHSRLRLRLDEVLSHYTQSRTTGRRWERIGKQGWVNDKIECWMNGASEGRSNIITL